GTFAVVGKRWGRFRREQQGFTLLELLVVMIIIAILAAIAIPVFFRQRDKGLVAQSQSALANAKLTAEAYYVGEEGDGSYLDLHDLDGTPELLEEEGLRHIDDLLLLVDASQDEYCIVAIHIALPEEHDWQTASVHSATGAPSDEDLCESAPA
ncbi:MAG TPA: type II secretion system protein, partial [Actinomycetota bacterium]|nr:type II secretion system protein [Actinomycetota bacterium]